MIAETSYSRLNPTSMGYGNVIARMRDEKGLTQDELAQAAGVSKFTVFQAERDAKTSRKTLRLIASALGMTLEELDKSAAAPANITINMATGDTKKVPQRIVKSLEEAAKASGKSFDDFVIRALADCLRDPPTATSLERDDR